MIRRRLARPAVAGRYCLILALLGLGWGGTLRAAIGADASPAAAAMRLLQAECVACHNPDKHKGGLVLTGRELLLRGGENGPVVVPGKPAESRLWQVLSAEADPHMPPKKQLPTNQVELVRRWIAAGVPWDDAVFQGNAASRRLQLEPLPAGYRPVLAVALSPTGSRLVFGRGQSLVLVDPNATNAPPLATVNLHPDAVRSVGWSPDGRAILSGSFRTVMLHDPATLQPRWVVTNLLGRITALQFSRFGGAVLVGDAEAGGAGWLRVLASDSGRQTAAWIAHADAIAEIATGIEGGLVATAGADQLVRFWEPVSQQEIFRLEAHGGAVYGLAANSNGTEVVTAGADRQIKLWDVGSRESVVTLPGRRQAGMAAAWSPDANQVFVAEDGGSLVSLSGFKRHNGEQSSATASERTLGRWPTTLHAVAASRDGRQVFAGGDDGIVRLVGNDGRLVREWAPPLATNPAVAAPVPSFVRDVLPVLARAGCAAGACHAKPEGQSGFRLSVFSYDPQSDYHEIVREARGRRIAPAAPEESLLLLKPTLAVEHGGGRRLEPGSPAHTTLVRWIRGGMPYRLTNEAALVRVSVTPREWTGGSNLTSQLSVKAHYADGTERDVTALADFLSGEPELAAVDDTGRVRAGTLHGETVVIARYQGFMDSVRVTVPSERRLPPEKYAGLPRHNFIDDHAWAHFQRLGWYPSDLCSDAEFYRRASLDVLGILPTPDEARAWLTVAEAPGASEPGAVRSRRAALVDQLLARPEYADYWANKWADLIRPNPDRVGIKSVYVLDQWLRDAFRANRPYDQFARDLILAEGSNHRHGPAVVYRDRREPAERTTMFSQLFLGTRLECARCHHHPNEKWSQDDFYQLAAVFGAVKQKGAGLSPPISAGTETFHFAPGGMVRHPVSEVVMKPRPLDGPEITGAGDPRLAFADWLTDPRNPFFARAAVNRVWAACFGRGLVEPVDDFRVSNPIVNDPLLTSLAADFARHGYDFKHLLRTIFNSRLYQLSSTPNEFNLADTRHFSRSLRRRLPAEVLLDAVNDVTGIPETYAGCPPGTRAMQTWTYKIGSQFLDAFGRPNASSDCPCERDARSSVVQALHLMNSRRLQEKLSASGGRVDRLAGGSLPPEGIVEELYLAVYSRRPTAAELVIARRAFAAPASRRLATEDLLWALLNSPEFVFNH